jgi:hypothetical protein
LSYVGFSIHIVMPTGKSRSTINYVEYLQNSLPFVDVSWHHDD